jgi:hypothetical protein
MDAQSKIKNALINHLVDLSQVSHIEENLEFPIEVFNENIQQIILEINQSLNFNKDFISMGVIHSLSVACGNKYKLRVKNGYTAPLIFWLCVIGSPGAMKTHPVNLMLKPIKNIDKIEFKKYKQAIDNWNSQEIKQGRKPKFKQLCVSDSTIEALCEVLDYNPRGVSFHKDEIVGLLNDMNKYRKGSDEQFWLESFSNQSMTINRVTKDTTVIDDININIIGTIQDDVLNQIISNHSDNGFIDRFLFSQTELKAYPINDVELRKEVLDAWDEVVNFYNEKSTYLDQEDIVYCEIKDDVMKYYMECDAEYVSYQMSDYENTVIKNYISKIKTYMPRFILFFIIQDVMFDDCDFKATLEHVEKAKKVCDYYLNNARKLFTETEHKRDIDNVFSSIKGATKSEIIKRLQVKGFKNSEIAKKLKVSKSYVSKILSS